MQLQRQHFRLSYFKTLSVGPTGVELTTSRVTARCSTNWTTDAQPTEPPMRGGVALPWNSKRRMRRSLSCFFVVTLLGLQNNKQTRTIKKTGNFNWSECLGLPQTGYGQQNCKTGHFKSWLVNASAKLAELLCFIVQCVNLRRSRHCRRHDCLRLPNPVPKVFHLPLPRCGRMKDEVEGVQSSLLIILVDISQLLHRKQDSERRLKKSPAATWRPLPWKGNRTQLFHPKKVTWWKLLHCKYHKPLLSSFG